MMENKTQFIIVEFFLVLVLFLLFLFFFKNFYFFKKSARHKFQLIKHYMKNLSIFHKMEILLA